MIKTAVVILNWNGLTFLKQFLGKVIESTKLSEGAEVILADNNSKDGSVGWLHTHFPSLRVILFDRNYGFTGGYNKALKQIEAKYYLLLNSDIEVTSGWLVPLVDYMDKNAEVAACAPKIRSFHQPEKFEHAGAAGGFMDRFGYPFCRGRVLEVLETDEGQYNNTVNVFWATGAALMIRSELYNETGGLDKHFFAHMEEIDLCWRLQRMGYRIVCIPSSEVYHVGGGALPSTSPRKLYLNFRNNLMMLTKNLTSFQLWYILPSRLVLDGLSGLTYLFSGKFSFFKAVIKAHFSFYRHLIRILRERKHIPASHYKLRGVYKGSIVLKYFMNKELKYSDIQNKITS